MKKESIKFLCFKNFFKGIFLLVLLGSSFSFAHGADLALSPFSGTFIAGVPFTIKISLKNNTSAINAVSGELSFPSTLLSISAISKTNSIVKLWADEPHYSNEAGTLQFEGVVLNPGFSGSEGTILSVTFIPQKTGDAEITFTTGSVLANDGKGTDVLGALNSGHFVITKTAGDFSPTATSPASTLLSPASSLVQSSTHPDSSRWYSVEDASFSWTVPDDVSAVRLLADSNPVSIPTHVYEPAISSKDVPGNQNGIHYFHVQFKNAHGWGAVSHFRYQIDTIRPAPFSVSFPHGDVSADPQPFIFFTTTDRFSGVDHFEIKIGEAELLTFVQKKTSDSFKLPLQVVGKHTVLVRAVDKAGNSTTESADFTIESITPPTLTRFSTELQEGEVFKVKGTTYPDSSVAVTLIDRNGESLSEITESSSLGDFALVWTNKLSPGVYKMSAVVTDNRGAKSSATEGVSITISQKAFFRIGTLVITYFMLGLLGIVAISILSFLVWYFLHKFSLFRKKISRTVSLTESALQKSFSDLKKEMREHLLALEKVQGKRDLTKEEKGIFELFEKRLNSIDRDIEARLKGLKK